MKQDIRIIDAEDKVLGRLATEVAFILQGKDKPIFAPNQDLGDVVVVKNVDKLVFTGKKAQQKKYYRHSGYLGNIKEISLGKLFFKNPEEVFRKAVWNMLPKNKLRKPRMKKLRFEKYAK